MGQAEFEVELVEATPYRLRYHIHEDAGAPGYGVIGNSGGATPDLWTDALAAAADDPEGRPLLSFVRTPVVDTPEARHILNGHRLPVGAPQIGNIWRCHLKIFHWDPTNTAWVWTVDAWEGLAAGDAPSTGYPVIVFGSEGVDRGDAKLDIHLTHTLIDSQ